MHRPVYSRRVGANKRGAVRRSFYEYFPHSLVRGTSRYLWSTTARGSPHSMCDSLRGAPCRSRSSSKHGAYVSLRSRICATLHAQRVHPRRAPHSQTGARARTTRVKDHDVANSCWRSACECVTAEDSDQRHSDGWAKRCGPRHTPWSASSPRAARR